MPRGGRAGESVGRQGQQATSGGRAGESVGRRGPQATSDGRGNAAIRHIQVECALLAAPLDAILAKIERYNIAHEARAPPTTTSPHPAAMLSTSPPPMTYVGAVLSTMGGSSQATSLTLAPVALPSPAIDGKLRMVRRRARPHRRVGRRHGPRAPNPQEHLLRGRRHRPRTPNQSTVNGWV